jgi:DNA repair photolyase
MTQSKEITGTREWSVASQNICTGCEHRCRYCYAAYNAVNRRQVADYAAWGEMVVHRQAVDADVQEIEDGAVMFPTTHDITPAILEDCLTIIRKHLEVGNQLLIVSKPHRACIARICAEFSDYKDQIMFRFSIGAANNEILRMWEPGAPDFYERHYCLRHAYARGYQTSVSCEPMLDSDNVRVLFNILKPFITHSFWIGKMNYMDRRVQPGIPAQEIVRVKNGQTDTRIWQIYERLKNEPLVKWKEPLRKVLGLALMQTAGEDV